MVEKAGYEDVKFLSSTFSSSSKSCSCLFDIEPEEINAASWFVSWYFHLEKPLSANDFDINWIVIRNSVFQFLYIKKFLFKSEIWRQSLFASSTLSNRKSNWNNLSIKAKHSQPLVPTKPHCQLSNVPPEFSVSSSNFFKSNLAYLLFELLE